eukprot:GABV01010280.1.p1 GENE.GABV01010280.1~~GABV01010280.1.p1  ORF type:complete len:139 (-),score=11.36 GABV01010280.1:83-499(-)
MAGKDSISNKTVVPMSQEDTRRDTEVSCGHFWKVKKICTFFSFAQSHMSSHALKRACTRNVLIRDYKRIDRFQLRPRTQQLMILFVRTTHFNTLEPWRKPQKTRPHAFGRRPFVHSTRQLGVNGWPCLGLMIDIKQAN